MSGFLDGIDQEALRWRYLARGEVKTDARIVYVDLDAETVSYMGDRPWDRREFGRLLAALLGPGSAEVVSLDIILSKFGAGALLDLERARKGDQFLGEIVEQYQDRVVLASAYTGVSSSITGDRADLPLIRDGFDDPERVPFPEAPTFPIIRFEVGRLALANVDEALSRGPVPFYVPAFVELRGPRYSLHLLDGAIRQFNHVLNEPEVVFAEDSVRILDRDGWEPMVLPAESEQSIFTLGLETFLAVHGLTAEDVVRSADALTIRSDDGVLRRIPLTQAQSIEVNWFEGWDMSADNSRVSMREVLVHADALAAAIQTGDVVGERAELRWFSQFEGKVVFVGPVDPQLKDIAPTPFNRFPVPKVALHANLYRTIETGAFIQRLGPVAQAYCIFGLTVLVSLLALGSDWARLASICVLLAYIGGAFLVFSGANWVLPLVTPVGSAMMASLSVVLLKVGSEEWQRRRIKNLFGAYVSPNLVDEMVDAQRDPELGGAEAEVTALFSDVEGFSALSEELAPVQLVALMNEYLGAMTEVFQAEKGTLDKYIGDAIVTMFGMPLPVPDHAARACRSALAMQERHAELRRRWAAEGKWPEKVLKMRTRIGINTGLAVIGNMGSEMRFDYTMMGDSVNLAARCESGAKSYGVYTMVTTETLEAALRDGEELFYRKLDRIIVKGRSQPVEIYELWDASVDKEQAHACKQDYEAGLKLYFARDWAAAKAKFEAARAHEPMAGTALTTPSDVLYARCCEFIEAGAPYDWDGVYRMRSK